MDGSLHPQSDDYVQENSTEQNIRSLYQFLKKEYSALYLINLETEQVQPFFYVDGKASLVDNGFDPKLTYTENVRRSINTYIFPDDKERAVYDLSIDRIRRHIASHGSFHAEYRSYRTGKFGYERLTVMPIGDEDTIAVLGIRDITQVTLEEIRHRNLLQDALSLAQHANQAKGVFLSSMAHDIRTPLSSIIGFADIGLRHDDDSERMKDCLEKISRSSKHLLNLINDILDVSRIESGKVQLENSPLNLFQLFDDLVNLFQLQAIERQIRFSVDVSDLVYPNVVGDQLRLNQIFLNIVGNAIKFTDPGGEVKVTVTQKEPTHLGYVPIRIQFEDTGRGMSEDFIKRIFKPYEREEETLRKVEGTGLGMAITKNLVDMMGGTIVVESQEGKGSTFTVDLELLQVDHPEKLEGTALDALDLLPKGDKPTQAEKPAAERYLNKRVLVVDDDDLSREIAVELLKERGFQVEEASDGMQAIERVKEGAPNHYDFVLMDVRMPNMDGYEATRQIRKLDREDAKSVPIIAATADAFMEDKERALESGMTAHVAKPINLRELIRVLDQCL